MYLFLAAELADTAYAVAGISQSQKAGMQTDKAAFAGIGFIRYHSIQQLPESK
jgi:hypothetical protein